MAPDDRTTKARIRDAAITEIAQRPVGTTTVRDIAAAADVSPGSVIHHYGSMDGLRDACNQFVAELVRTSKGEAVRTPSGLDVLGSLHSLSDLPITAYLAKTIVDDSPAVAKLIDEMVDDALAYTEDGVAAGTLRPSDDPRGRAILLTVWILGGLVLHSHLERLLGVDITDPEVFASPEVGAYFAPAIDILANGVLEPSYAIEMAAAIDAATSTFQRDTEPSKGRP